MTDNLPKTLTCPSCGAPLEVDGKSALVRCKFCKNVAFVPGIAAAQDDRAGHDPASEHAGELPDG